MCLSHASRRSSPANAKCTSAHRGTGVVSFDVPRSVCEVLGVVVAAVVLVAVVVVVVVVMNVVLAVVVVVAGVVLVVVAVVVVVVLVVVVVVVAVILVVAATFVVVVVVVVVAQVVVVLVVVVQVVVVFVVVVQVVVVLVVVAVVVMAVFLDVVVVADAVVLVVAVEAPQCHVQDLVVHVEVHDDHSVHREVVEAHLQVGGIHTNSFRVHLSDVETLQSALAQVAHHPRGIVVLQLQRARMHDQHLSRQLAKF